MRFSNTVRPHCRRARQQRGQPRARHCQSDTCLVAPSSRRTLLPRTPRSNYAELVDRFATLSAQLSDCIDEMSVHH